MKKLTYRLAIASAGFALMAASPALAQTGDVKLGFIGGFTGPIESLVPPIFEGAKLAVAEVNAAGGILNAQTLTITAADGGCDATGAANAADRLVNTEQVTAIVGALCSGETIAAANNAAIPGGVVMVSPASTSPPVSDIVDNDLVFRTVTSDAFQGAALAGLVLSKDIDEVVLTYVNNDYGAGFADAFTTAFEAGGGEVVASAAHEEGRADYRPELGTLSGEGVPNLVVLAYASGSGQTVMRQAVESGNFSVFIGGDGMVGSELFTGIDPTAVEGMIATKPGVPDIPGAALYAAIATAAGQDPTAVFGPQAYDAAMLLALAIEANGSADRAGLSASLREVASAPGEVILPGEWAKAKALIDAGTDINYEGASGSHEFDANGDVPGVIVEMTVTNGQFVEVGLIP